MDRRDFAKLFASIAAALPFTSLHAQAQRIESALHRGPASLETLLDDWLLLVERGGIPIDTVNSRMALHFEYIGHKPPTSVEYCVGWRRALSIGPHLWS